MTKAPSGVSQTDGVLSKAALARATFSRMSSALAVHSNDIGALLCSAMYSMMASIRAGTLLKENTSLQSLHSQVSEPAFDHVEPRTARWCEVHVEAFVT